MDNLNNQQEAAKKLNISTQTLRKIISSGGIKYVLIHRTKKISDKEIENFINKTNIANAKNS